MSQPTHEECTANVLAWIEAELEEYADVKYSGTNREMNRERVLVWTADPSAEKQAALDFITSYLKRAELFGLDLPQGRQALAKAAVTCINYLAYVMEDGATMPRPGVPSGEIEEWT